MLFSFLALFLQTEEGAYTNAVTYRAYLVKSMRNVTSCVNFIITHIIKIPQEDYPFFGNGTFSFDIF